MSDYLNNVGITALWGVTSIASVLVAMAIVTLMSDYMDGKDLIGIPAFVAQIVAPAVIAWLGWTALYTMGALS